jgi:hypothetical protein
LGSSRGDRGEEEEEVDVVVDKPLGELEPRDFGVLVFFCLLL